MLQKIIIYLFEKYAYNYWIEKEEEKIKDYIEKHGCSQEEFDEHLKVYSRIELEKASNQAYNQGCVDMIEKNLTKN